MHYLKLSPDAQTFVNEEISRTATRNTIMSTAIGLVIASHLNLPSDASNIKEHYANSVAPGALMYVEQFLNAMPIDMPAVSLAVESFYIWRFNVSQGRIVERMPAKKEENVLPNSLGLSHVVSAEQLAALDDADFKAYYTGASSIMTSIVENNHD